MDMLSMVLKTSGTGIDQTDTETSINSSGYVTDSPRQDLINPKEHTLSPTAIPPHWSPPPIIPLQEITTTDPLIEKLRRDLSTEFTQVNYSSLRQGILPNLISTFNSPTNWKGKQDELIPQFRQFERTKFEPIVDELWKIYSRQKNEIYGDGDIMADDKKEELRRRINCSLANLRKVEFKADGCDCGEEQHERWQRTALEKQIYEEFTKPNVIDKGEFNYDNFSLISSIENVQFYPTNMPLPSNTACLYNDNNNTSSYSYNLHGACVSTTTYVHNHRHNPYTLKKPQQSSDCCKKRQSISTKKNNKYDENDDQDVKVLKVVVGKSKSSSSSSSSRYCNTDVLEKWYDNNLEHPYADKKTIEVLSKECGLEKERVRKWLANRRNRRRNIKKPCEIANKNRKEK